MMPGIGVRLALRAGNYCLNIHPLTIYLWPAKFQQPLKSEQLADKDGNVFVQTLFSFKILCFSWDRIETKRI